MDTKIKEEDLWCEYSDLPSPKAYIKCADYDSMGNHGRFPKQKTKDISEMIVRNFKYEPIKPITVKPNER